MLEVAASQLRHYAGQVFSRAEVRNWLWLAAALIAIDLLYRLASRRSRNPASAYAAPSHIYRHRSSILDYKFFLIHKLLIAFLIAPLLVSALALGEWGAAWLNGWLGPGPGWQLGPVTLAFFGLADLILFDVGHYISHYIQHKSAFFWEFHKIHHAAEVLTPITSFRVHPVETVLDTLIQAPLQAAALAVFYYVYGPPPSLMTIVWISAIFPLYFLIDCLRHSHLWVSFGSPLEYILSSPAQHQIHHSTAPHHLDKNFSRYFSFLDWIGGTLYVAKEEERLEFGLAAGNDPEIDSVRSLLWVPFKRALRATR